LGGGPSDGGVKQPHGRRNSKAVSSTVSKYTPSKVVSNKGERNHMVEVARSTITTPPNTTLNTNQQIRDVIDVANSKDNRGRIALGSRKDFHIMAITQNWLKPNKEIAVNLGISEASVYRYRRLIRNDPNIFSIALDDYLSLRLDVDVPKSMRFQAAVSILTKVLGDRVKAKDLEGKSVLIRIIDDVKAKAPNPTQ